MDLELTLETMGTVAGVVAFMELILILGKKLALHRWEDSPDYGLILNVAAILLGFVGCLAAQWATEGAVTGQGLVEVLYRTIQAAGIAIGGFELVKHLKQSRAARNGE